MAESIGSSPPVVQQDAGSLKCSPSTGGAEAEPKLRNGARGEYVKGKECDDAACLSHHKNDSGSYDIPPNGLATNSASASSAGVTILISNEPESGCGSPPAPAPGSGPTSRTHSSASVHSEMHITAHPSSSSSSLSCDLSHASSFNSKELLEQLVKDFSHASMSLDNGEPLDRNEVVQQLLEHIITLKLELEELKLENRKLCQVRSVMDDELHTLTENLFGEAYKMVDTAKEEKGLAVKKLADAAGKIDAMETEMFALKNLLHAPPTLESSQTASPHSKHRKPNVKKALRKLSNRIKTPSKSSLDRASAAAVTPHQFLEHKSEVKGACLKEGQMDPNEFSMFSEWLSDLSHGDHPYLLKVLEEDIKPCLSFRNKRLSVELLTAVRSNDLLMESLSVCTADEERMCVLSSCQICCTHRMQLASSREWQFISQHCRDRIAAVCDLYMYISHIEKGILKQDESLLYWQVNRLRAQINLARLTLELPD